MHYSTLFNIKIPKKFVFPDYLQIEKQYMYTKETFNPI